MASTDDSAPDATSIKPVASLRSRFETLGTDSTPRSFTKSPNLSTASPSRHGARMSLDLRREDTSSAKGLGLGHLQINAHSSHIRHASTSSPKSASMIDLSTTPTVIVDAPVSPVQRSPPRRLSPRSSFVTPSRSSTDQGAIRPNVTLHKPLRSMTGTDAHAAASATAAVATAAAKAKPVPPPINRAGKPGAIATPVLGSSLVQPPGASPAHAPSPFSTPPSSAEGTPIERQADNDFGFASMPTRPAVGHPYNNNGYFAQARREAPHTHTGNRPTVVERAAQTRPSFTTASSTPSIRRINPPDPAQAQHISPNADATILQDIDQRRSSAFSIPSRPTATSQGFDRQPHSLPLSKSPPAAPPSRRSVDLRRDPPPPPRPTSRLKDYETHTSASDAPSQLDASRTLQEPAQAEVVADPSAYPDQSRSNRRPPRNRTGVDQIPTGYETRLCAISGDFVCTSGYVTRIWSVSTGNKLTTIPHDENVRAMSISWKPTKEVIDEHKFLWLGTNDGSLLEVNVTTGMLVNSRQRAHARGAIIRIYSHQSSLYTLDDEAHLYVWSSDDTGSPSLNQTPATHRVTKGHTASIVVDNHLWFVCGKDVQIYRLSAPSDADFQVLQRPLCQESAGIVTSAAILSDRPTELYFGHADGKVSLYDTTNYSCIGVYNVGLYKISTLTGVGSLLWAGYNTGMIYVYDTTVSPWRIVKEWKAHAQPITSIVCDQSSIWETGDLQVVSLGMDNTLQLWDGLLHDDRLSQAMQSHDVEYCTFQDISAAVLTWNVGATTPSTLRSSRADSAYLSEYLASTQSADILMFGFQELVDLEDKKLTAKSFFKSKKRAPTEQEHISSQYRAWRDYLVKSIEECLPKESYRLVHTATMVGLFTCLLVKSHVSSRVKHVSTDEIKRGIGGLHGNKVCCESTRRSTADISRAHCCFDS